MATVLEHWWTLGAFFFAQFLLFYFSSASLCYWWFRKAGRRWTAAMRIQDAGPQPGQIRGEIVWSIASVTVFSLVVAGIWFLWQAGLTQIYLDIHTYGSAYFWLSVLLMLLLHDTWFYWTHRFMHWRPVFKWLHLRHHRSRQPTPFACYAFTPGEALIEVWILVVIAVIMPAHPLAIWLFLGIQHLYNLSGHMGYEFFPKNLTRHPILKWSNSPTHHDMHHLNFKGNYGIYFNFWDRLMGTNQAGYEARFEAISERRRGG